MSNEQGKTVMVQGRLVQVFGDLFAGQIAKVYGTQQPKLNKAGQQFKEYGFSLAVPKSACADVWAALHEVAYTLYPNRQIPPNFHMKFKDGDTGTDDKGNALNTREGYAGCIILTCKNSGFPPTFFRNDGQGNIQIADGIKCGDYVNVQLAIKAHAGVNAGLYLNPMAVQFLGYGPAIISAPSGDQIFGAAAPQMPAGASAVPLAGQGMLVPPASGTSPQSYAPPLQQQTPANWNVVPQQYVPPGTPAAQGFVPPPTSTGGQMSSGQAAMPSAFPSNGFPPMPR